MVCRPIFIAGLTACAIFLSASPAMCQVVVEESVTTDTVDLFSKNTSSQKSGILGMGASLLLPGLGQQYFGQNGRAFAYFSAEALFIFGAVFCDHYSKQIFTNAKAYAWEHAMATGGAGVDDKFWQNVRYFDESDGLNQAISRGYNKEQELINRSQDHDYLASNLQWRWDDPLNRKSYGTLLDKSRTYQVASSFFIGAMILDRLVSFIDVRFAAQHQASAPRSSMRVSPQYDPQNGSSGISLSAEF
jgi:TM2 domain-containing membrane protein YozV